MRYVRRQVLTDAEGYVLVDRSGTHFGLVLNFLRDGQVAMPTCRQRVSEILAEARYYCVQGLIDLCNECLSASGEASELASVCRVPIISTAKEERALLHSTMQPVIKLLLNRHNNKYSYTNQSDDNLLKNLELFDKLVSRFNERILFMKDVGAANEVCSWTFYGHRRKVAEVCCTSIVYATDKKHTKVEFPEARIYEEAMNILLYEVQPADCACHGGQPTVTPLCHTCSGESTSSMVEQDLGWCGRQIACNGRHAQVVWPRVRRRRRCPHRRRRRKQTNAIGNNVSLRTMSTR
jgi:hypothetical protein